VNETLEAARGLIEHAEVQRIQLDGSDRRRIPSSASGRGLPLVGTLAIRELSADDRLGEVESGCRDRILRCRLTGSRRLSSEITAAVAPRRLFQRSPSRRSAARYRA
jgi:hypothetical protein